MKKIITIFLFLFYLISFSQNDTLKKRFSITEKTFYDFSKMYYKENGEKVLEEDFFKLVKNKINFSIEKIINEKGEIEKYFLSKELKKTSPRDITKRVKNGDVFPNFIVKTIKGEEINLKKLKGKTVILRFELFADNFRFKKNEIKELDKKINQFGKEKVVAIIIFTTPKNEVIRGFNIENTNFKLVADGMSFNERYFINWYPTTIIIDSDGNLDKYYKNSEKIILKN